MKPSELFTILSVVVLSSAAVAGLVFYLDTRQHQNLTTLSINLNTQIETLRTGFQTLTLAIKQPNNQLSLLAQAIEETNRETTARIRQMHNDLNYLTTTVTTLKDQLEFSLNLPALQIPPANTYNQSTPPVQPPITEPSPRSSSAFTGTLPSVND